MSRTLALSLVMRGLLVPVVLVGCLMTATSRTLAQQAPDRTRLREAVSRAKSLMEQAVLIEKEGNPTEAIEQYEQLLPLTRTIAAPDSVPTIAITQRLASLYVGN